MKKSFLTFYLVVLHIGLLALFYKPDLLNKIYNKLAIKDHLDGHDYYMQHMWEYFANRSKTLSPESDQIIFFGDSMTSGLCVESYFRAVNFGISGERVRVAKDQILEIENLENKRIVLAYGINDIPDNVNVIAENYKHLITRLPKSSTIYISSVLPVNEVILKKETGKIKSNLQIKELNQLLEEYALGEERIHYMETFKYLYDTEGQLSEHLQKGNGLHLNNEGMRLWAKAIADVLESPQISTAEATTALLK